MHIQRPLTAENYLILDPNSPDLDPEPAAGTIARHGANAQTRRPSDDDDRRGLRDEGRRRSSWEPGCSEVALVPEAVVRLPLAMMNRHGLIAGATGTGKTRTLQVIAEQLSAAGVAVFAADVKGDLSGMAVPGANDGPAKKRATELGLAFTPTGFPVEYLSLGGHRRRASRCARRSPTSARCCSRKVLGANETQEQSLALVFHYADEKGLPLLDLSDLRALLTFLDSDEGKAELKGIGGLSPRRPSACSCARSSALEDGRRQRVLRRAAARHRRPAAHRAGRARRSSRCLELPAVQDKPTLFSTALMWLLAELFEQLPEVGDRDKPKLVFFFDEAHLLFDGATQGVPRVGRRRRCG